jgi:hypothetical protein
MALPNALVRPDVGNGILSNRFAFAFYWNFLLSSCIS